MTDLEKAREFFAGDIFATSTSGIVIDEVGDRYAKCSMKIDDRHVNARGTVMGGAIYTLADFTFAVAANHQNPGTVSVVGQISYMGVAKGDTLIGESHLIKDGRSNCFYNIDITDNLGNKVAAVSMNGVHLN
ncbi:MAG: PaaI family thioesterase [Lachnospiraceae bacterium]|nr:PaaI family thioesterase [Lachnospiraceae bacterium]